MRVVISGAGISGLAAAIALAPVADRIDLVERAPGPRPEGYYIDYSGVGIPAAQRLGVLDDLRAQGCHFDEIWHTDPSGRVRHRFSIRALARHARDRYFHILRPQIEETLRHALPAQAHLHYGEVVSALEDPVSSAPASVTLSGGETLDADLVLVAEGQRSRLRHELLGAERDCLHPLGISSMAWIADAPELAAELGSCYAMSRTVGVQLGVAGLGDGRVSVYGIERHEGAQPPPSDPEALRRRYAVTGAFGERLLATRPEQVYCDAVAQVRLPRWRSGRVLAIGDAAHAPSLISGQGAQLAIAGAELLGRRLGEARRHGGSVESALDDYDRQWRPVVEKVQRSARRRAPLFAGRNRFDLVVRELVMATATLPGLDRLGVALTTHAGKAVS